MTACVPNEKQKYRLLLRIMVVVAAALECQARPLPWGKNPVSDCGVDPVEIPYEVVLMSDVVYDPDVYLPLIQVSG
jgi:hypothetical protein